MKQKKVKVDKEPKEPKEPKKPKEPKEPKEPKPKEPKEPKAEPKKKATAATAATSERGFDVNERYQKKEQLEHVLLRPDTYIGGTDKIDRDEWIWQPETGITQKKISYSPGLYKIFDEILVNARDHTVRDPSCNRIRVDFNPETGEITVENNGNGIPVEWHEKGDCYLPELVFGVFMSGENYSDTEEKTVGGRNGFGSKVSSAFSLRFFVDTVDNVTGQRYTQLWENNMSVRHEPVISKYSKASYTRVSFIPDYNRLGKSSLKDADLLALLSRRVYDMAACTREDVLIYLNGEKLNIRTFNKYIDLFLGSSKTDKPRIVAELEDQSEPAHPDRSWDITVALSEDGGFKQFSLVNGIATTDGGTHVAYIRDQLVRKISKLIRDKNPNDEIKPGYIRENLWLFINAVVVNPSFASQTKESLSLKAEKFGFKHNISDELVATIEKRLQISKRAMGVAGLRVESALKKTDGKKKAKIYGILKLEDAKQAGKKRALDCTLIVTEGDSAKTMAMDGLQIIGRDLFGIYPLRGKFINVRNASVDQLQTNVEYGQLKEILGLREGADYTDEKMRNTLRYGSVMLMNDQDVDGFHIKGLFYNFILVKWPSLLSIPGFFKCFITPIVRLQPSNARKTALLFFNLGEFEVYRKSHSLAGYQVRYLKGLGTSEKKEAREYFADFNRFVKVYQPVDQQITFDQFDHAFNDKFADWRKEWLGSYDENHTFDYGSSVFQLDEFVDRELKHFSIYDNKRSIGHAVDGLKVSQRKVIWGLRKIGLWNTTKKVLAVAGDISSASSYHHGEKSLMDTMIGMAQTFVGSNNINELYPSGQFGCLDPETQVLMWNGKKEKAKNIRIGDTLVGDDGTQRTVLQTVVGEAEMYEVIQNHQQMTYKVNDSHILTLKCLLHKRIYWKNNRWMMEYVQNGKLKSKCISTKESSSNSHYNASVLTKEEGHSLMIEFAKTISDNDVFDIDIKSYLALAPSVKKRFKGIICQKPIQWPKVHTRIDPYVLGMWLGDGLSTGKGFASADEILVKEWVKWQNSIGVEVVHYKNCGTEGYQYGFRRCGSDHNNRNRDIIGIGHEDQSSETCIGCQTSTKTHPACDWVYEEKNNDCNETYDMINSRGCKRNDMNPFVNLLNTYNLVNNKHIPSEYIINDEETRLQLLAGLLDTDGTLKKGIDGITNAFEISQAIVRSDLIDQIVYLCNSLGFKTSVYKATKPQTSGVISIQRNVRITGDISRIPTKLQRKRPTKVDRTMCPYASDIQVKPVGKGNFVGWQVDKNERFLLGDFTITHNSRLNNGKDAADPRYIFTKLNGITRQIYKDADDAVLRYEQDDEGKMIEPRYFVPIIAMVLVNGCQGIGTGYSTTVPMYNPLDIINRYLGLIRGDADLPGLVPWYNNFCGTIEAVPDSPGLFDTCGCYKRLDDYTLEITEVPVGESFDGYKTFIESHLMENMPNGITDAKKAASAQSKHFIKDYQSATFPSRCNFKLTFSDKSILDEMLADPKGPKGVLKKLRLVSRLSTKNMYLFGCDGAIRKFSSPEEIIEYHYNIRLATYASRKQSQLEELDAKILALDKRQRFIQLVLDGSIEVRNRSKQSVASSIIEHGLVDAAGSEGAEETEGAEAEDVVLSAEMKSLLKISLYDITKEEVDKFLDKIATLREERKTLANTPLEAIYTLELNELRQATIEHLKYSSLDSEDEQLAKLTARIAKGAKGAKVVVAAPKKARVFRLDV